MARTGRRRFIGSVGGVAALLGGRGDAQAQAFPKASIPETEQRRRRLAKALRELNDAAVLGVTSEELERAEAYVTGAILEAEAKLRPLVLPEGLDLPVVFRARRRS